MLPVIDSRFNILVYLVTFVLSWLLFALLWWAMQNWNGHSCVEGVDGFTTALLFSIETQHTIGYGSRAVTDRCLGAVTLLMLQSVCGAVTQCIITGIIFAKVSCGIIVYKLFTYLPYLATFQSCCCWPDCLELFARRHAESRGF